MTTAFVLTGGGSLGAIQVGMLQALAEHGIEPDVLIGTSVGALNAAWVATHGTAAADLQALADLWCGLTRREVFPLRAPRVLRALTGRGESLVSPDSLRALVDRCTPTSRTLEATRIPLHVIAADLLTGQTARIDHGTLTDAVMASSAIPGIFPPVPIGGRLLVDGAVADTTGISLAHDLGVDEVYILPTGTSCALPHPPTSALSQAMQALSLLTHHHTASDTARLASTTSLRVLPPLCPVRTAVSDFTHAADLITRARNASREWIDSGNIDLPDPHRFLMTHDHDVASTQQGQQPATPGPPEGQVAT